MWEYIIQVGVYHTSGSMSYKWEYVIQVGVCHTSGSMSYKWDIYCKWEIYYGREIVYKWEIYLNSGRHVLGEIGSARKIWRLRLYGM